MSREREREAVQSEWEALADAVNRLVHDRSLEPRWRQEAAARAASLVRTARALDDAGWWHLAPAFAYLPDHPSFRLPPRLAPLAGEASLRPWPSPARRAPEPPLPEPPAPEAASVPGAAPAPAPARAPAGVQPRRPALCAEQEGDLPLHTWRELLRRGQVSAEELARAVRERIARLDGQVRAFVALVPEDRVREEARRADEARKRGRAGPLAGLPVAVKDVMDVAGLPTTAGSRVMEGYVAPRDAGAVARLREAGAVIVGKTATHEFAFGPTTDTPYHGPVHNPWAPDHTAGGSSGGSGAAVAARMVPAALGTDTAGSVRIPAAACGVVGFMPTYGRIGRSGVVPLSWSCDHVGVLALTVADAALVAGAMAGPDPEDPVTGSHSDSGMAGLADLALAWAEATRAGTRALSGLRVGVPSAWLARVHPEVEAAFVHALELLEELGARVYEVDLPPLDLVRLANRLIVVAEAGALHAGTLARRAEDYSDPVRSRLEPGQLILARDYLWGQRLRAECVRAVNAAMRHVDLLALPTLPVPAPRLGQEELPWPDGTEPVGDALIRLTLPFNLTGQPALSLPCGFSREGLPVALQLAARPFQEHVLVRAGAVLEVAFGLAPGSRGG